MGRKRIENKKKKISVSINEKTLNEIDEIGIENRSRFFQLAADKLLSKNKEDSNSEKS